MELPQAYYNSRSFALVWFIFLILAFAGSSWLLYKIIAHGSMSPYLLHWTFASIYGFFSAFLGAFSFILFRRIFSREPRLTLTVLGITDHTQKHGEISWADIKGSYIRFSKTGTFLCLELRSAEVYLSRISPISRWLTRFNPASGFTAVVINLSGVNVKPEELQASIASLKV